MYLTYAYFYLEVPQSWEKSVFNLFPDLCFFIHCGSLAICKDALTFTFFFFFFEESYLCALLNPQGAVFIPQKGILHRGHRQNSRHSWGPLFAPGKLYLLSLFEGKRKLEKSFWVSIDKKNFKRTLVKSILEISFPDITILKISQNIFTCR